MLRFPAAAAAAAAEAAAVAPRPAQLLQQQQQQQLERVAATAAEFEPLSPAPPLAAIEELLNRAPAAPARAPRPAFDAVYPQLFDDPPLPPRASPPPRPPAEEPPRPAAASLAQLSAAANAAVPRPLAALVEEYLRRSLDAEDLRARAAADAARASPAAAEALWTRRSVSQAVEARCGDGRPVRHSFTGSVAALDMVAAAADLDAALARSAETVSGDLCAALFDRAVCALQLQRAVDERVRNSPWDLAARARPLHRPQPHPHLDAVLGLARALLFVASAVALAIDGAAAAADRSGLPPPLADALARIAAAPRPGLYLSGFLDDVRSWAQTLGSVALASRDPRALEELADAAASTHAGAGWASPLLQVPATDSDRFLRDLQRVLTPRTLAREDSTAPPLMLLDESDMQALLDQFPFRKQALALLPPRGVPIPEPAVIRPLFAHLSSLVALFRLVLPMLKDRRSLLAYIGGVCIQLLHDVNDAARPALADAPAAVRSFFFDSMSELVLDVLRMVMRVSKMGVWHMLNAVPFERLSVDAKWTALGVLLRLDEDHFELLAGAGAAARAPYASGDVGSLARTVQDSSMMAGECVVLALSRLAVSSPLDLAIAAVDALLQLGYRDASTRVLLYKSVREALVQCCRVHTTLLARVLAELDRDFVSQITRYFVAKLPFELLDLSDSELDIVRRWLMAGLGSEPLAAALTLLEGLGWDAQTGFVLRLKPEWHVRVALLLLETVVHYAGEVDRMRRGADSDARSQLLQLVISVVGISTRLVHRAPDGERLLPPGRDEVIFAAAGVSEAAAVAAPEKLSALVCYSLLQIGEAGTSKSALGPRLLLALAEGGGFPDLFVRAASDNVATVRRWLSERKEFAASFTLIVVHSFAGISKESLLSWVRSWNQGLVPTPSALVPMPSAISAPSASSAPPPLVGSAPVVLVSAYLLCRLHQVGSRELAQLLGLLVEVLLSGVGAKWPANPCVRAFLDQTSFVATVLSLDLAPILSALQAAMRAVGSTPDSFVAWHSKGAPPPQSLYTQLQDPIAASSSAAVPAWARIHGTHCFAQYDALFLETLSVLPWMRRMALEFLSQPRRARPDSFGAALRKSGLRKGFESLPSTRWISWLLDIGLDHPLYPSILQGAMWMFTLAATAEHSRSPAMVGHLFLAEDVAPGLRQKFSTHMAQKRAELADLMSKSVDFPIRHGYSLYTTEFLEFLAEAETLVAQATSVGMWLKFSTVTSSVDFQLYSRLLLMSTCEDLQVLHDRAAWAWDRLMDTAALTAPLTEAAVSSASASGAARATSHRMEQMQVAAVRATEAARLANSDGLVDSLSESSSFAAQSDNCVRPPPAVRVPRDYIPIDQLVVSFGEAEMAQFVERFRLLDLRRQNYAARLSVAAVEFGRLTRALYITETTVSQVRQSCALSDRCARPAVLIGSVQNSQHDDAVAAMLPIQLRSMELSSEMLVGRLLAGTAELESLMPALHLANHLLQGPPVGFQPPRSASVEIVPAYEIVVRVLFGFAVILDGGSAGSPLVSSFAAHYLVPLYKMYIPLLTSRARLALLRFLCQNNVRAQVLLAPFAEVAPADEFVEIYRAFAASTARLQLITVDDFFEALFAKSFVAGHCHEADATKLLTMWFGRLIGPAPRRPRDPPAVDVASRRERSLLEKSAIAVILGTIQRVQDPAPIYELLIDTLVRPISSPANQPVVPLVRSLWVILAGTVEHLAPPLLRRTLRRVAAEIWTLPTSRGSALQVCAPVLSEFGLIGLIVGRRAAELSSLDACSLLEDWFGALLLPRDIGVPAFSAEDRTEAAHAVRAYHGAVALVQRVHADAVTFYWETISSRWMLSMPAYVMQAFMLGMDSEPWSLWLPNAGTLSQMIAIARDVVDTNRFYFYLLREIVPRTNWRPLAAVPPEAPGLRELLLFVWFVVASHPLPLRGVLTSMLFAPLLETPGLSRVPLNWLEQAWAVFEPAFRLRYWRPSAEASSLAGSSRVSSPSTTAGSAAASVASTASARSPANGSLRALPTFNSPAAPAEMSVSAVSSDISTPFVAAQYVIRLLMRICQLSPETAVDRPALLLDILQRATYLHDLCDSEYAAALTDAAISVTLSARVAVVRGGEGGHAGRRDADAAAGRHLAALCRLLDGGGAFSSNLERDAERALEAVVRSDALGVVFVASGMAAATSMDPHRIVAVLDRLLAVHFVETRDWDLAMRALRQLRIGAQMSLSVFVHASAPLAAAAYFADVARGNDPALWDMMREYFASLIVPDNAPLVLLAPHAVFCRLLERFGATLVPEATCDAFNTSLMQVLEPKRKKSLMSFMMASARTQPDAVIGLARALGTVAQHRLGNHAEAAAHAAAVRALAKSATGFATLTSEIGDLQPGAPTPHLTALLQAVQKLSPSDQWILLLGIC
jgi:hypothetical protein